MKIEIKKIISIITNVNIINKKNKNMNSYANFNVTISRIIINFVMNSIVNVKINNDLIVY